MKKITINYFTKINIWVLLVFFTSSYVSFISGHGVTGILNSIKFFLIIFMAWFVMFKAESLSFEQIKKYLVIYGAVIAIVPMIQIVLWLKGLPVNGIFFHFFPRPKGLAHEPSTFGMLMLFFIAMAVTIKSKKLTFHMPYILFIGLGLLLTVSFSALVGIAVTIIMFYFYVLFKRNVKGVGRSIILGLMFFVFFFLGIQVLFPGVLPIFLVKIKGLLGAYVIERMSIPAILDVLRNNLFVGVGYQNLKNVAAVLGFWTSNGYVMVLAELGIILAPVFFILNIINWANIVKTFNNLELNNRMEILFLFLYIVIGIPVIMLSLYIYNYHTTWISIALFYKYVYEIKKRANN
ncbi:hypothetical protein ACFL57_02645 [Candidatus Margulisiibacteriota bacterium]